MKFIKWNNVVLGYQSTALNYPFSAEVNESGIYVVSGQNGSGKTALIKTSLGLLKPISGSVRIFQKDLNKNKNILKNISYVPQFSKVNSFFHIGLSDFVIQGLGPKPKISKKELNLELENLLAEWQLLAIKNKSFHELSGGQKTRALIVRALIRQPKILFLDEPLSSLDPCCQKQLMKTLYELSELNGICVIMIEHHYKSYTDFLTGFVNFNREHDTITSKVDFQLS